jgi:hypothetical protein
MMEIVFTKAGNEEYVLSCKRKDGSVTWHHVDDFFVLHDLCHFAVETGLRIKNGFFGMLAAGTDITEFDLPKQQRTVQLTAEALFSEQLVNLLVIDHTQGRMDNLVEVFYSIHGENTDTFFLQQLNEEKLDEIRIKYTGLVYQWKLMPLDHSLSLVFEI